MESLEREQKQIDCQADELETELRSVMNTGETFFNIQFLNCSLLFYILFCLL